MIMFQKGREISTRTIDNGEVSCPLLPPDQGIGEGKSEKKNKLARLYDRCVGFLFESFYGFEAYLDSLSPLLHSATSSSIYTLSNIRLE